MLITIKNPALEVVVDTLGAQLMELNHEGTPYLWNGNEKYWKNRAPVLFPTVGRLQDGCHLCKGQKLPMELHGFSRFKEFTVVSQTESSVSLCLSDSEEIRAEYPFAFDFIVSYTLRHSTVDIGYEVRNKGDETMYFGLGAHPGFNVPFVPGTEFEDYYLRFSRPCHPEKVLFSPSLLYNRAIEPYELEDGQNIRLTHDLFDGDALVLRDMAREVSICCDKSPVKVTVSYPDLPYIGFWHMPHTDAPYVCIEPWGCLPGRDGVIEDFACRSDYVHLGAHECYRNIYSVTISK